MLIVALISGVRYGELVGLSIEDINFKENTIKIRQQWCYKEDGGFGSLINESSEHTIDLDKATMNIFKKQVLKIANDPPNEIHLVFFTPDSPIKIISNDVFRSSMRKLKIKPVITVHGLRHTHASVLLYKNISVSYISGRLGHASIDFTTSTYTHLLKELSERDSVKTCLIFEDLIASNE